MVRLHTRDKTSLVCLNKRQSVTFIDVTLCPYLVRERARERRFRVNNEAPVFRLGPLVPGTTVSYLVQLLMCRTVSWGVSLLCATRRVVVGAGERLSVQAGNRQAGRLQSHVVRSQQTVPAAAHERP